MNAALLAAIVFAAFALGYRFYSSFLSRRVFGLSADEPVPSRQREDGVDFVPTPLRILWGHHYTSIAGAAPIVGPAIAVIWGWLPALLWVTLGTLFMGAVHDLAALVISIRNRGASIGEIAGHVINPRVRALFLIIISFLIWIVLAVFAYIIGTLFQSNPGSVFPIWIQLVLALGLGWLVHRRGIRILFPSLVAYAILLASIFYGDAFANQFPFVKEISVTSWVWILLIYSLVASVLPIWVLLQPRDYLNSHQLITALVLLSLGLLVLRPEIVAPAIQLAPEGAPPMIPFLFITIACGAISGFHGLVASGTTSKQLEKAPDARPIGFGGMLGEGSLGLLAVLAATAGFSTTASWKVHYASWGAANGLSAKLGAFVTGGANFIASLGIPVESGKTFMAVVVIAFAATSLDTGARIQRLVIAELADSYGWKLLTNRFAAGGVGIAAALLLALTQGGGKGGLLLWPLFGTTNQLVAGVTLLIVSIWLKRSGKPVIYTVVPMVLVTGVTVWAMVSELIEYFAHFDERWLLAAIGSAILVLDLWVLLEGLRLLFGGDGTNSDEVRPEAA